MELIRKIGIHSFKSIVETGSEFELGRVNFFIGSNGSGKSNYLEAIGVLSAAANGRVDDDSLKTRGVRPGRPRIYKSAFNDRMSPQITLNAKSDSSSFLVSLLNPLEDPIDSWGYKNEDFTINGIQIVGRAPRSKSSETIEPDRGKAALKLAELDPHDNASKFLRRLQNYAIYAPVTPVLRGAPFPDGKTRNPVGLYGERLSDALEEFIKYSSGSEMGEERMHEILEMLDWVKNFDTHTSASEILSPSVPRANRVIRFTDRFMREGYNRLTGYDASEGALYILYIAMLALHPHAPEFFAIDNFDQALNPRLTRALVRNFSRWILDNPNNAQVLCTTHNPIALDGLPLNDPEVRLFVVDRDSGGRTVIKKLEFEFLRNLHNTHNEMPLSKMWVMGLLGGVPDV